jgi:hypothetical protein
MSLYARQFAFKTLRQSFRSAFAEPALAAAPLVALPLLYWDRPVCRNIYPMSFTLMDMGSENFEFTANVWHWKAALGIIKSLDIVSESLIRQMGYNATGVKVSIDDAHFIGEKIRDVVLPRLPAGKRMYSDLSVTDAPDDMTLYKDEDEQWKNYSVDHEWLTEFAEFCLRSKGFQIF